MPADDRRTGPAELTGSAQDSGGAERVVRVIPDVVGMRKVFDYLVPPSLDAVVDVGTEVRIVLHNRRVGGWVIEDHVVPSAGMALRPLAAVRGVGPPQGVLDLAQWAAWRWAGAVPTFLRTASSARAVRSLAPARAREQRPGEGAPGEGAPGEGAPGEQAARPVGDVGSVVDQALSGGTSIVRLAPAADAYRLVEAVADRLSAMVASPSLLVLAPAHRSVAELAQRLRRSGHEVAELPDQWPRARAGGCIVIGSRAAAFAPLEHLDAAVVLDAHDEAYVEERAPTWCAWEVVAERARRAGAPCVLVSPVPTLELLAAGRAVHVSRRAERSGWPIVEVIDRTVDDPRTGMFSPRLVTVLRWAGESEGRRVACVLNRTGRVRLLACAACNSLARCEHCGGAVELIDGASGASDGPEGAVGRGGDVFSCRRCRAQRPVVCASCGATRFKALRSGVTRVRDELAALTNSTVAEMWGPATPGPHGDEAIIVGTEAVLHRVGRLDAVCFLDFDAELLAPRLHGAEEAFGLLARAARLVAHSTFDDHGADDRSAGRVLVQTRQARHEVLRAAVMADPEILTRAELEIRQLLRLPPVTAIAAVSGAAADVYGPLLRAAAPPGVEVSGPLDGAWSVKADNHQLLCDLLASVERPPGRMRVEVDPVRR